MKIKDFEDKGFVKGVNPKLLTLDTADYKIVILMRYRYASTINKLYFARLECDKGKIQVDNTTPKFATKFINTFLTEALGLDKIFDK